MNANILYYRVTEQKSPCGKILGWNILGGFDPVLVQKTATYVESALVTLTTIQLEAKVAKLVQRANAVSAVDVSSPGMLKCLARNDGICPNHPR